MATVVVDEDRIGPGLQVGVPFSDDLVIEAGVTVQRTDGNTYLAYAVSFGGTMVADIHGSVYANGVAIQASSNSSHFGRINFHDDAIVKSSGFSALRLTHGGWDVTNAGELEGITFGILFDGRGSLNSKVTNSGTIAAIGPNGVGIGFVEEAQSPFAIVNNGIISGEKYSYDAYNSFSGAVGNIVNNGQMIGDIQFSRRHESGYGTNDLYDGRLGRVDGTVFGAAGKDTLLGGDHADVFDGGIGDDILSGGGGNDRLYGRAGNDRLDGGDGDDFLDGGSGHDRIFGGAGRDTIYGSSGNDIIEGGAGYDFIDGGSGEDTMRGGTGNDVIFGRDGNDLIYGARGRDTIHGGAGNDTVYGGSSADVIIGGLNKDTLKGGAGADRFVYETLRDSTMHVSNRDVIADFSRSEKDKIDLSALDANTERAGNQSFKFIGTAAFSKTPGELRYKIAEGKTTIYADVDGDGKGDFAIDLSREFSLQATDFIL